MEATLAPHANTAHLPCGHVFSPCALVFHFLVLAHRYRLKFSMRRSIASMSSKLQALRQSAANGSLKKRRNRLWTSGEDGWLATQKITNEFSWQNLADAYAVKFPKRTVKALKHRKDFLFQRAHSEKAHSEKDT